MGSGFDIPHTRTDPLPGGLDEIAGAGFTLLGLSPNPSGIDISELSVAPDQRVALLIGSEGEGLSPATIDAVDATVRIPMVPNVDSLNAGVAASIAFFALSQQRRVTEPG